MNPAIKLSLLASGLFLFTGLCTGVWKYQQMMSDPEGRSHVYVDIAHRAALLYSFAALVIAKLLEFNTQPVTLQLISSGAVYFFFTTALIAYISHGIRKQTENQFRHHNFITTWGMYLLILGELGGFSIVFWGFISNVIL